MLIKSLFITFQIALIAVEVLGQTTTDTATIDEKKLTEQELRAFEELTKQKIDELQTYLQIISNKDKENTDIDLAIKNALKLFTPEAQMEVTFYKEGLISKVISYPMKKYFHRLRALPYSKVEITFYNIAYIGKFLKGVDGRYYATATIFQEFKGFNGDKLVYKDKQAKQINIVMEYTFDDFYNEWNWTVLLDDIKCIDKT